MLATIRGQRSEMVIKYEPTVVKHPSDQRAFAVIDAAAREKPQKTLFRRHQK
jgi:hypothetical protein